MFERFLLSPILLRTFVVVDCLLVVVLIAAALAALGSLPATTVYDESSPQGDHRLIESVPEGLPRSMAHQFDLNEEGNIATAISALQFLLTAVLAFLIGRYERFRSAAMGMAWMLVAAGLLFLMAEELFEIHEYFGSLFPSTGSLSLGPFTWAGRSRWVVLYIVPLAVAAAFVLTVFWRTFSDDRRNRALSLTGLACWAVAVACESLMNVVPRNLVRTEILVEESFELLGAVLLIVVFQGHLRGQRKDPSTAAAKSV